jgi:hypothetical protein
MDWTWPRHIVKADNQSGARPSNAMMPVDLGERDLACGGEAVGSAYCRHDARAHRAEGYGAATGGHDRHAEPAGLDDADGWRPADDEPMSHTSRRFTGLLVPEDQWRSLAACRSADPDLFFPISSSGQSTAQVAEAKAVCAGCRVRRECLAFALRTHQVHGCGVA